MTVEELLEDIRGLLEQQLKKLEKTTRTAGPKPPGKEAESDASVMGVVKQLVGAFGRATAAVLAFVALPALMTAAVAPFVAALNPGLMAQFNQVLDNLQATIGSGLEPIISQAVLSIREFSSMLGPMMRDLRPVIADFAHTVADVVMASFALLASFRSLWTAIAGPVMRVFGMLTRLFTQLMEALAVFNDVVSSMVVEFVSSVIGANALGDAMDWLKNAVIRCTQWLTMMTVALMKAVGLGEVVTRFRTALAKRIEERKNPTGGLVAAPKDVSTSGAEDIARRMAERAFAAVAGAGAARTDTDLLEGILKAVEEGASMDLVKMIRDGVAAGLRDAKDALVSMVPGAETGRSVVSAVKDVSSTALRLSPLGVAATLFGRITD